MKSEVALLHSYDSRWAINWQRHNKNYDPNMELRSYYAAVRPVAQSVDILPPTANLSSYKLVVAPGLNVLSDAAAKNLAEYVRSGGHLVLGQRSAMKDDDNGLQPDRQPGPLGELLGGRVEQYYALVDPVPVEGQWGTGESPFWAELLSIKDNGYGGFAALREEQWLAGWPARRDNAESRQWAASRISVHGSIPRPWRTP